MEQKRTSTSTSNNKLVESIHLSENLPKLDKRMKSKNENVLYEDAYLMNMIQSHYGRGLLSYLVIQLLAFIIMALMVIWIWQHFGGFFYADNSNNNQSMGNRFINFHAIIMVFSMVYILSNSLLFLTTSKTIHGIRIMVSLAIVVFAIIGNMITIYWHHIAGEPHFRSMHSWLAILTWLSLVTFLFFTRRIYSSGTQLSDDERIKSLYYVRLLGMATLMLVLFSCLLGLNQYFLWDTLVIDQTNTTTTFTWNEQLKGRPNLVGNVIAMFLVFYCVSMICLINRKHYRPLTVPLLNERKIRKQIQLTLRNRLNEERQMQQQQQQQQTTLSNDPDY